MSTSKWSVECTQFRASIIQLNVPKTITHVNNCEHPLAVQFSDDVIKHRNLEMFTLDGLIQRTRVQTDAKLAVRFLRS